MSENQMPLVKLSDKERIEIGKKAANCAKKLEQLKTEYNEVKKQWNADIEEVTNLLIENLRTLREQ